LRDDGDRRDQTVTFARRREVTEQARGEPAERRDDQELLDGMVDRRHRPDDETLEHRVGGHEETAEQRNERQSEGEAARDGAGPPTPQLTVDSLPRMSSWMRNTPPASAENPATPSPAA
jgi:hypothetical protein